MKVEVTHTTRLDYGDEVVEAVMDVRLGPVSDSDQRVNHFDLHVGPHGSVRRYTDGFGNPTHLVTVPKPHRFVDLTARTELETFLEDPFRLPEQSPAPLDARTLADHLQPSPLIPLHQDVAAMAEPFRPTEPEQAFDAARGLMSQVHSVLRYRKEITTVGTTADEVLRGRAGVCQDFAHLLIGLARCLGLPARYVSGYIVLWGQSQNQRSGHRSQSQSQSQSRSQAAGRSTPSRGAGASHAWAEVYTASHGWRGFDPTNNLVSNDHYVKVATGRDYRDVAPTRGTYRGPADEHLSVAVATRVLG